ncbi:MAG: AMP-binding protein [Candidatus Rokubacteria bacterium]|nr:AMP-binding protein [Candidatus Rokubacteria bacterium]
MPDLLLRHRGTAVARKIALVDGPHRITYADLLDRSLRLAALVKDAGLAKGDRVGIFLRRSIEAVVAFFATHLAGGVAVVLNERLRGGQVRYVLEHSEAALLVTDSHQLLHAGAPPAGAMGIVELDRVTPTRALATPERAIGADLALIIYTSGSTGLPKGVMVSHQNLLSGARIVSDYLDLTEQDVVISLLPFSFDYGLNQLLTTLLRGGTLVLQRSLFPPDICRTLQRENVTGMAGVPTLWQQLTQGHSPFPVTTFPRLRYITNSGGRLPEATVRLIRRAHPRVAVHLMYGLTEAFRSTCLPPAEVDRRPSSIGKAIPDVEILVLDERGRPCGTGEVGELVHRGANVTLGYWRDPDASARVFRPHPFAPGRTGGREVVVYSGDLVTTDAEGYLYFVGRKDQLIKSRGVRVSPDEIEEQIFSSGLVSQVAAFAVPRDEVDSDIVVAVIPRDAAEFREAPLRRFCRGAMPDYMQPRVFWRVEELPLTTSCKVDRPALRAAYLAGGRSA